MARAYAVSNHKKIIFWVLGTLYLSSIGCEVVGHYKDPCFLDWFDSYAWS